MSRVETEFQGDPAQYMLNFWASGVDALPKELHDEWETIPLEKRLNDLRDSIHYDLTDEGEKASNARLRTELEEGGRAREIGMNNFWNLFTPSNVKRFIVPAEDHPSGIIFALLPFAIDQVCNGAWSRMCQEKRGEVERVIRGAAHRDQYDNFKDPAFDPESFRNTLCELALYLNQQGVPLTALYG